MKFILNSSEGVINIDQITRIKFLTNEDNAEIIFGFRVYLADNAGPINIMEGDAGFDELRWDIEEYGGLTLTTAADVRLDIPSLPPAGSI